MGVRVKTKGSFKYMEKYLAGVKKFDPIPILTKYGEMGVRRLSAETPVFTGRAASSWYYEIVETDEGYELQYNNRDVENGLNVIFLIRQGHVNFSGGWVPANDFVTPIIEDLFKNLSKELERRYS